MADQVLEGIRVLDFGRYIAGPFCGAMLADFGAEVIRVEKLDGSEDRFVAPVGPGAGANFITMARNKKGLTLNPMKPEGQAVLKRLLPTVDVVIANLPLPTLKAMQIDYDSLKKIKPDIILTMVSAFGIDGPYADRVGFDTLGQAMSGAMYMTGDDDMPRRASAPYVDFGTALLSAFGTMAALRERDKTGRGQLVESSLFSTAMTFMNSQHIEQSVLKLDRPPQGNRGVTAAPVDCFKTEDGFIFVLAIGYPLFERWTKLVGAEGWASDPRFATDEGRGDHADLICDRMQQWCDGRTTAQALADLEDARIPGGPILNLQEALDDPHVNARGLHKYLDYPGVASAAPLMETPVRLSVTPGTIRHRAPLLGEHTDEILKGVGYSDEEIQQLHERRIV
ncbi:MAG: crotonobetainyl-CoA:carnitine CoA-transferase CaiB-like acyl-CoA transferase [Gammaproteobacteria bacterium]|jgi:crotonobetainyl-CoA:carnitine CoA-transferase CaiB-like acyl-CoA transferase